MRHAVQTYRDKLYPLCERLRRVAIEIIDQCELTVTARGFTEPKILALALLGRDAAHPTLAALARHWGKHDDKTGYFDAVPQPKESELDETAAPDDLTGLF